MADAVCELRQDVETVWLQMGLLAKLDVVVVVSMLAQASGILAYHASLVIPETASKWRSRLSRGKECWRHNAAIQTSLEGIGVPALFNSLRTAL